MEKEGEHKRTLLRVSHMWKEERIHHIDQIEKGPSEG